MKQSTLTLIIAALLLLAALICPVSAARTVMSGGDVFVYETIVIPDANGSPLIKYSGDATPVVLNTISGTSYGSYDLLEEAVGTYTGTYYYNGDPRTGGNTINIWYPEMSLKAYLGAFSFDTIDGKTITKSSDVRFVVESPKVGAASTATAAGGLNPVVRILFTTPVGGKTTDFGVNINGATVSFDNLYFNGSVQIISPVAKPGDDTNAGTYVAQAEFKGADSSTGTFPGIPDKYKKSNTISFTIQSDTVTLTANKDTVIRSNPFTVVIQGTAQTLYFVHLENNAASRTPELQPGQNGMRSGPNFMTIPEDIYDLHNDPATWAYFSTDASGRRTVQYNTYPDTEPITYTIKAIKVSTQDGVTYSTEPWYDTTEVTVERGEVTITASEDRNYYLGDKIKLTGTNTDSTDIFLFITGPQMLSDGQMLTVLPDNREAGTLRYGDVLVKTDNTWEYTWDTAGLPLETDIYTIYATSVLTNGKSFAPAYNETTGESSAALQDSTYATLALNFNDPYLTATASGTALSQGGKITVTGEATGSPQVLKMYIFGPDYYASQLLNLKKDGTYESNLYISSNLSDEYSIVIEHPGLNGLFGVIENRTPDNQITLATLSPMGSTSHSFIVWGSNKLSGANAADALSKMIDGAEIDDIYQNILVTIEQPWVLINNPGTHVPGTAVTLDGTTNLGAGEQMLIKVIPPATATGKSGTSQFVTVAKGDDTSNSWSLTVSTTGWDLGEYQINATGIENECFASASLSLVSRVSSPDTLILTPGWNFISVPKTLAPGSNTAATLFKDVDTDNHAPLAYDAEKSSWVTLAGTDIIKPMTGIWVYAAASAAVPLSYPDPFTVVPAVKNVYPGWNAVGLSADYATAAENALAGTSWRTLLPWNVPAGKWDAAIINGGTGANSPDRLMTTGNGYWLYLSEAGTLTGFTA